MAAQQPDPDDATILYNYKDNPEAHVDPYSYCFETNDYDDSSMAEKHGRLVVMLLKACNLLEEVEAKLNSHKGRYSMCDAQELLIKVADHIGENIEVYAPVKEDPCGHRCIWAVGVLAYYLFCGYPLLETRKQIETYNAIGLGPKFESDAWKELERNGHRFLSKQWRRLEKVPRVSIRNWSHYHKPLRRDVEGFFDEPLLPFHSYEWYHFCGSLDALEQGRVFDEQPYSSDKEDSMRAVIDRQENDLKVARKKRARAPDPQQETSVNEWKLLLDKARNQSRKKERKIYGDLHGSQRNGNLTGGPSNIETEGQ